MEDFRAWIIEENDGNSSAFPVAENKFYEKLVEYTTETVIGKT